MERVRLRGFRIGNLDATVVAREPRLALYREAMEKEIARVLEADVAQVNVKITSHDGLGALGRGEGMSASAVVLLEDATP